jgi:hypothetical protein
VQVLLHFTTSNQQVILGSGKGHVFNQSLVLLLEQSASLCMVGIVGIIPAMDLGL